MNVYIGVGNKAKKVKNLYIGVENKAKKIKKIYVGVNKKAKLFFCDDNANGVR